MAATGHGRLSERCSCCGRNLPGADDPQLQGDIRIGNTWLRGRMLIPDFGLPVRLTPKQTEILSLLARRPGGILATVLADALGISEGSAKVQVWHLRVLLNEAECGLSVPRQEPGRGNRAVYRLKIEKGLAA